MRLILLALCAGFAALILAAAKAARPARRNPFRKG